MACFFLPFQLFFWLVLLFLFQFMGVSFFFFFSFFVVFFVSFCWWRDVHRESLMEGFHSFFVVFGLKVGMVLFIVSEVFFFVSFFWAFFHSSVSPSVDLGIVWPPLDVFSFDPMSIPLFNTIILLSSGVSVTVSHHFIMVSSFYGGAFYLIFTIFFGLVFSFFQGVEYFFAPFSISDSVFGSVFFMSTGFHGLHVLIGSVFLFVTFFRLVGKSFSFVHMVGFECAAWYWHFVDVVWLFLYSVVYWWGG